MRSKTLKPPKLNLVKPAPTPAEPEVTPPTRPLGPAGRRLWTDVMATYSIDDYGGREILLAACEATDRATQLGEIIDRDGPLVQGRTGLREHPLLRAELGSRAFAVRALQKLGLDVEPVQRMGRPPGPGRF